MKQSTIHLDFQCPKKWNTMEPQNHGRFCVDCNKMVTDFSKIPRDSFNIIAPTEIDQESCGSFSALQLDRPFNNWKDKLVSFYQNKTFYKSEYKLIRQAGLFLIMIALITTGCARRLTGRFVCSKDCKKPNHGHEKMQTLENKK